MKQNIYDDPAFFAGYEKMRQLDGGSNKLIEAPTMRDLIPARVSGDALDLGCGAGQLSSELAARGARRVLGVDLSEKILARAAGATAGRTNVEYRRIAIEDFEAPAESFDLIVSSLALHYVRDYSVVVASASRWLRPGGELIFSVEHPVITGSPKNWVFDSNGKVRHFGLDNYLREGIRRKRWFVDGVVIYHRTLETLLGELLRNGLELAAFREPQAREDLLPSDRDAWPTSDRLDLRVPSFIFIKARKPGRKS